MTAGQPAFARPAFTWNVHSIAQPHFALRRRVCHPPDDCGISLDLAKKRPFQNSRSLAKFSVLYLEREMAINELRRALSRIKKLETIGQRTAFEQYARCRATGVATQIDTRFMFQSGTLLGHGLAGIIDRPIKRNFIIRHTDVNRPALRRNYRLPRDCGGSFGVPRDPRLRLPQARGGTFSHGS